MNYLDLRVSAYVPPNLRGLAVDDSVGNLSVKILGGNLESYCEGDVVRVHLTSEQCESVRIHPNVEVPANNIELLEKKTQKRRNVGSQR